MLTSALAYASLGMCVFPVAADCRKPLTPHGYKDATTDLQQIERLWHRRPNANLAVATGHVSGVFVLDVDVKGANGLCTLADLEATRGALPATWRTITPTGGRHVWFRQPERALRNRVGFLPGLDVRTDGGSVAAPPSRRADGTYQWKIAPWDRPLAAAPEWLLDLIDQPLVARPPSPPVRFASTDRATRYAAAVVNGECREIAATGAGGRNARLFQGAARIGELVGAGLLPPDLAERELEIAAHDCGLVHDDGRYAVLASIKSGLARGVAKPRQVML